MGSGVCLALLLIEFGFLRLMLGLHGLREATGVFEYDATRGWRFRPGAVGVHSDLDFQVHYRINSDGLRDVEHPREKSLGTIRVLAVGDSFTEGLGVEAEETFAKRLEPLLTGQLGRSVEIINAGIRGTSTDQQYLYLSQQGMSFHPDLVLLAFVRGDEDNTPNAGYMGSRNYFKPYFRLNGESLELQGVPVPLPDDGAIARDALEPVKRILRPLAIYRLVQSVVLGSRARPLLVRLGIVKKVVPSSAELEIGDQLTFGEDAWRVEEQLLRRMKETASTSGAGFAIFLAVGSTKYADKLREVTGRLAIPFMDVSNQSAFADGVARGALLLPHDGHWNKRGHLLAAEILSPFVAQQIAHTRETLVSATDQH
jgi:hypothetical protein